MTIIEAYKKPIAAIALLLVTAMVLYPGLLPRVLNAQPGGQSGQVLTPQNLYPDEQSRQLATKYQSMLQQVASQVKSKFKPDVFHMYTTPETYVGGVGFWVNPGQFGQPGRYLGVFAKAQLTDNPFRDDQPGHVAAIMDRYGKDIMAVQAEVLKNVKDPMIRGVAVVIVFSKEPINSPYFSQASEAMAVFVSPQDLMTFTTYRLTLQKLLNQNDLFLFQGSDQINALTQYFIQP